MYAVWWAQISAFVGSMTKKCPCPSGGWGQKMNKDKQALSIAVILFDASYSIEHDVDSLF